MIRILGLDPGLRHTGWGLIEKDGPKFRFISAGVINPDTKLPYSVRKQGAGMVDVYGAVDNNVIATSNDEAKIELREVNNGQTFEIKLTNYGKETANYW